MVTINLKVSMCRDIIANSNMTKAYFINPCDSCNNDVNTPLNAIHVHIYSDYVIHFECIYVHSTCIIIVSLRHTRKRLRHETRLINDVIYTSRACAKA